VPISGVLYFVTPVIGWVTEAVHSKENFNLALIIGDIGSILQLMTLPPLEI